MRSIDIHAHLMPHGMLSLPWRYLARGERCTERPGRLVYGVGERRRALTPQFAWNTEQRLVDMDSLGVDVQVVSTFIGYYQFPLRAQAIAACCEANDEVGKWPATTGPFCGALHLPLQNLHAAIDELERSVTHLGLKGAMLNDTIHGLTFDAPELPFWQAAEQLGALLFVHQGGPTVVSPRADRYHLPNTIGNLADRAVTFASLVFGVMDQCPDLKVCLAHGGGYTCFGIGRMDRGWQCVPRRGRTSSSPSTYLRKFYYDCLTHSEAAVY